MKQVIRKSIRDANNIIESNVTYTLLIDGNNLLKKSLVDRRENSEGKEYGGIYQFLYQINRFLKVKDFNYVYTFWDGDYSGSLRYNIYKDYKANRDKHYGECQSEYDKAIMDFCKRADKYYASKRGEVKRIETDDEVFQRQRGVLMNILEELFVRQLMCDDIEGDDLIAYYVNNKNDDDKVVIVSEDRDLSQLISDTVTLYIPSIKKYVTPENSIDVLGITHKNIVLEKIICGDNSDNIKGIKGVGKTTFIKTFPDVIKNERSVDDIVNEASRINEERVRNKKKPLKVLENIVNKVTEGCQGSDIYDINKRIIDLSEPMMTEEAVDAMKSLMYVPIDPEGRDMKNVYDIITKLGMNDLLAENSFGNLFGIFEGLIKREKDFFYKNS